MPVRVGLMIATPDDSGEELLDGIVEFVHLNPHWTAESSAWWNPRRPADFNGFDGLIIRGPERFGKTVQNLNIPIVDISCSYPMPPRIPRVCPDNYAIGALAAEHFLERGYRNLAFVGRPSVLFTEFRLAGFGDTARQAGCDVSVFVEPGMLGWSRDSVIGPMRQWISGLPRPLAVMGDDDETARLILEACRNVLHVPEDVAVIGVNNNEHLCGLSTPALSSIDTASERVGFRAAQLLDDMINGHKPPTEPIFCAPGEVRVRRSSDTYAINDPAVAKAVRYIHDNAVEGITLRELCSHVLLAPRTLELRFRQATGRSPRDQIRLMKIQCAMKLLATAMPIALVAAQAGFSSQSRFGQMFRKHTGQSPLQYRRGLHEGTIKAVTASHGLPGGGSTRARGNRKS